MTRLVIPLLLTLSLAACAPDSDEQTVATEQSQAAAAAAAQPVVAEPGATTTPPPVSESGCVDAQAQWLVGKTATEADVEQARKDAKAAVVRQLKPGQAVTLEFNDSRLNVELDAKGIVTAVRCG
jgi:hypothetical protein